MKVKGQIGYTRKVIKVVLRTQVRTRNPTCFINRVRMFFRSHYKFYDFSIPCDFTGPPFRHTRSDVVHQSRDLPCRTTCGT